jgi:hypothetical protein
MKSFLPKKQKMLILLVGLVERNHSVEELASSKALELAAS